jgi:hypothetical protein
MLYLAGAVRVQQRLWHGIREADIMGNTQGIPARTEVNPGSAPPERNITILEWA